MKIYIAGKITGDPDYKEKFAKVASSLREHGFSYRIGKIVRGHGLSYTQRNS